MTLTFTDPDPYGRGAFTDVIQHSSRYECDKIGTIWNKPGRNQKRIVLTNCTLDEKEFEQLVKVVRKA
jgi:hypothetical protein